jgi:hypothetical protein
MKLRHIALAAALAATPLVSLAQTTYTQRHDINARKPISRAASLRATAAGS